MSELSFTGMRTALRHRYLALWDLGWTYQDMSAASGVPVHVFQKWLSNVQRQPRDVDRLDQLLQGALKLESGG